MRTAYRRPIATSLLLVGSMILFAGCGDDGAHLPAGMTGASAAYSATGTDGVEGFLGGDPGPTTAGVSSQIDDPVLAGYDGIDEVGELGTDDVYGRAIADWNENEGSMSSLDSDIGLDDGGLMPAGYGGGYGYDDGGFNAGFGYGNGLMTAAMNGTGWGGNAGLMDAGFEDPGFADAGFVDPGFEDPGFADAGFDAGIADPGFVDPGFAAGADPGFVDAGFDPGVADVGFDPGIADAGVMDVGIDAGAGIEGMVF
jgi:hypothetical protein